MRWQGWRSRAIWKPASTWTESRPTHTFWHTNYKKDTKFSAIIDDEFLADLYCSSPLHDIGKVGICDSILLKPGTTYR